MPSTYSRDEPFTVLLVCTGNICRSALGERLGRACLEDVSDEDGAQIRLISAGTRAVVGSAMHPASALVLQGLGGDPSGFRARQLRQRMIVEADLILTMTRHHRRDVLRLAPQALARTFTLLEAAELLHSSNEHVDASRGRPAGGPHGLVTAMAAARSGRRGGIADDIQDPIGHPPAVHQDVGDTIAAALLPVTRRLFASGAEGTQLGPAHHRSARGSGRERPSAQDTHLL